MPSIHRPSRRSPIPHLSSFSASLHISIHMHRIDNTPVVKQLSDELSKLLLVPDFKTRSNNLSIMVDSIKLTGSIVDVLFVCVRCALPWTPFLECSHAMRNLQARAGIDGWMLTLDSRRMKVFDGTTKSAILKGFD